ncbi:MAG TPA: filamentous hemagglutinin N-terminal domain-containing protein, partial [Caldimonas sp.]
MRSLRRRPLQSPTRLAIAIACALGAAQSQADPKGPAVVAGQASFVSAGKTLTITNAPGTIIQWQGFSIASDELTRFIQQSSRSSVLNRVVGQDPSSLLGRLESNGRVFLINPNGIVFGQGARIDVAGLVASTLDLSDADFLAGRLRFIGTAEAGPLTQLGMIRTQAGGQVVLIAPRVDNAGSIVAPGGAIVLAAGQSVQLADAATPELRVTIAARPGEVVNVGELVAQGGRVGIHAGLIRQDGTVRADRAEWGPAGEVLLRGSSVELGQNSVTSASGSTGGRITVDAGTGTVRASGQLLATADGGRGGTVRVLGGDIELPAPTIDASGTAGGGEILIGGDVHGGNAAIANARTTTIGAGTRLHADGGATGTGGKVVVWSDGATAFAGSIDARGGAAAGNGGFVEVSGKGTLDFRGAVDTSAAHGATGTLLLDPSDITISTAANASMSAGPNFVGTAAASNLNVTTLQTALASNNVIVDTTSAFAGTGDITVNNAVTWASGNSLDLRAHNNITVAAGATINATGTGALRLIANQDAAGGGDVTINAALTAHSGGISISGVGISSVAAGTLTTTGLANQDAGTVSIAATGAVNLGGAIVATGGAAGAASVGRNAGAVSISGTNVTTAAITSSGSAGNGANQAGGNGATIGIGGNGTISTGALIANGGAAGGGIAAGGNAGTITVSNASVAGGTLTTGALTARAGAATGAMLSGSAGSVAVTESAAALLSVGAIDVSGQAGGSGG